MYRRGAGARCSSADSQGLLMFDSSAFCDNGGDRRSLNHCARNALLPSDICIRCQTSRSPSFALVALASPHDLDLIYVRGSQIVFCRSVI